MNNREKSVDRAWVKVSKICTKLLSSNDTDYCTESVSIAPWLNLELTVVRSENSGSPLSIEIYAIRSKEGLVDGVTIYDFRTIERYVRYLVNCWL